MKRLTSQTGIVGFGVDQSNQDVLMADLYNGIVRLLVYDSTSTGAPLPATLADTGAFTNVAILTTAPGLIAYEPNVSFWSDYAVKSRWFALKDTTHTYGFNTNGNWTLPAGAVWMKHFYLETMRGDPSNVRRVATRFIVKTTDSVYGITYRWNDVQTNATLVPRRRRFPRHHGDRERRPAHPNLALPEPHQLSRVPHAARRPRTLVQHPTVESSVSQRRDQPDQRARRGRLFEYDDPAGTVLAPGLVTGRRAVEVAVSSRPFLSGRELRVVPPEPGGSALGNWDARYSTALNAAGIVDGALINNPGNSANRVIKPGDRDLSELLARISANSVYRMPPVGSNEVDPHGSGLVAEWIVALDGNTRTGLEDVYYNNTTLAVAPVLRRTDPVVDFNWGRGSPATGVINTGNFSSRWSRRVKTTHASGVQSCTFYIRGVDGVRLWVNGVKLIDRWVAQEATEYSGTITLGADKDCTIPMEYQERGGDGSAQLRWSSSSVPKQLIPPAYLLSE